MLGERAGTIERQSENRTDRQSNSPAIISANPSAMIREFGRGRGCRAGSGRRETTRLTGREVGKQRHQDHEGDELGTLHIDLPEALHRRRPAAAGRRSPDSKGSLLRARR